MVKVENLKGWFVLPRLIFTSTSYDVVDVLLLVARQTFIGDSFATVFIPVV